MSNSQTQPPLTYEMSITETFNFVKLCLDSKQWQGVLRNRTRNLNKFAINKKTKQKVFDEESIRKAFSTEKGLLRPITAPNRKWKEINSLIATLLDILVQDSSISTGFRASHDVQDNASRHLGKKHHFYVDIKNAFGNVKEKDVSRMFRKLGFKARDSHDLARLCTLKGEMPQGFPASPKILNVQMKTLDIRLMNYCKRAGITVTRYADDLAFSKDKPFTQAQINSIIGIIKSEGWEIARKKVLLSKERYLQLTGIVLDNKNRKTFQKSRNKQIRKLMENLEFVGATESVLGNSVKMVKKGQIAYDLLARGQTRKDKTFSRWLGGSESVRVRRFMRQVIKLSYYDYPKHYTPSGISKIDSYNLKRINWALPKWFNRKIIVTNK